MKKENLRWTQDQEYVWHAVNKEGAIGFALCGEVEAARSGLFKYPRHMLAYSDICAECNKKAVEVLNG